MPLTKRRLSPSSSSPMRYLTYLASLTILFAGCAEFVGDAQRLASINVRVPSNTPQGVAADTDRVIQVVGTIASRHGFTLRPRSQASGNNLYVVPGYGGGPWPGQPDVDWEGGPTWTVVYAGSQNTTGTARCSVYPPKTGDVLKIDVSVQYSSRMPPSAKAFWEDLLAEVTNIFGRDSVLKVEELK